MSEGTLTQKKTAELTCTVVSLVPFEIFEEKPGLIPGRYHVPASDGKVPQVLHVKTGIHYVYLDQDRGHLQVRNPPDSIAKSIVEDFINAQLGISDTAQPGMFWEYGELSAGDVLSSDKLERAKTMQRAWFINLCKIADDDWQTYHKHNTVSSFQRKAAEALGWNPAEHEWMAPHVSLTSDRCPSCGMTYMAGNVICGNCKCVLDSEKYKDLQFAK